ncbi:MAG: oligosaccharide flippase family protein [Rubripirellula sp.]
MKEKSESSKFLRNSSWLVGSQGVRAVCLLLQSIVITRALGISKYGEYAIVVAFVGPILELFNANFGAALIRYGAIYEEQGQLRKLRALIKFSYLMSFGFCIATTVVVSTLAICFYNYFFEIEGLAVPLMLYAAAASLGLVDAISFSLLRLFDCFKISAIVQATVSFLSLIFIFTISSVVTPSVGTYILMVSGSIVISSSILTATTIYELKHKLKGVISAKLSCLKEDARQIFKFSFGNSLAQTLDKSTRRCDILLLGVLANREAVAIYDVARKVGITLLLVRDPLSMAVFPQIARLLGQKNYAAFRGLMRETYKKIIPLIVVAILVLFFASSEIAGLWGEEFREAGWTTFLLSSRAMVFFVFFWTNSLILSLGRVRFQFVVSLVTTVIGFAIAMPLTTRFGANGMAFSMLLASLSMNVVLAVFGIRVVNKMDSRNSHAAITLPQNLE